MRAASGEQRGMISRVTNPESTFLHRQNNRPTRTLLHRPLTHILIIGLISITQFICRNVLSNMQIRAVARRGVDLLQRTSHTPFSRHPDPVFQIQTPISKASFAHAGWPPSFLQTSQSLCNGLQSNDRREKAHSRPEKADLINTFISGPFLTSSMRTNVETIGRKENEAFRMGPSSGPWGLSREKIQLRPLDRRRYFSSTAFMKTSKDELSKGIAESAKASAQAVSKATKIRPTSTQLKGRLPQMPHIHRPTKEELLAAATGFWSRLKVRFKWFSIRSVRPFNVDEISGFLSWLLVGHVLWIVLGTTTFFSLAIWAINTVFAQGVLCKLLLFLVLTNDW